LRAAQLQLKHMYYLRFLIIAALKESKAAATAGQDVTT
jgi:hypothetical protein